VARGHGRTIRATVADERSLRSLQVWLDGRSIRTWALGGSSATRSAYLSASRLTVGRHAVRWVVRDAAGNARTRTFWLVVR
jgi:hypothetical protein